MLSSDQFGTYTVSRSDSSLRAAHTTLGRLFLCAKAPHSLSMAFFNKRASVDIDPPIASRTAISQSRDDFVSEGVVVTDRVGAYRIDNLAITGTA